MLTKDALSVEVRGRLHEKELRHNCDTKPAFTDFFDRSHLLILWKLLKTQMCSKIPAYRLIRHNYLKDEYLDFFATEMRQNCDSFRTEVISFSY
jgi:hypothetical protein